MADPFGIEPFQSDMTPDEERAAREEWERENYLRRRYAPGKITRLDGRNSGWGLGRTGQCRGCKRTRGHVQIGPCPGCGYLDGAGYVGVPAQSSYLHR